MIKSYNDEVKRLIKANNDQDDAINIDIHDSTGLVSITLSKNYKVLFNRNNTFRDQLGFDAIEISCGTVVNAKTVVNHVASKVCDLWPTQSIYMHCSVVKGNKKLLTKGV